MKNWIFLILGLYLSFPGIAQDEATSILESRGEVCFWFIKPSGHQMKDLSRMVSIDKISADTIFAYANRKEYAALRNLGIQPVLIQAPSLVGDVRMSGKEKGSNVWTSYPTYEAYLAMMAGFASSHPHICRLDTIGVSKNGRLLLAVKISDSAQVEQAEPQVFYSSSIHGDETTGFGLMLHLIDSLLTGYGTSTQITSLVDSLEIWINPLANPDGTYYSGNSSVSGATRYNANSIDLNRNFPDPEDGQHPDENSWQPETIAMMNFMKSKHFVLSANFHGGAEVMNYPWDTWETRYPDDSWFQFLSHIFADSSKFYGPPGYFSDVVSNGVTDGYDWYSISGGRQDYMTYFLHGREITIEISSVKMIPGSLLPSYWQYNYRSLLHYLEQAYYGIQGVVSDSVSGLPVGAKIEILNHDLDGAQSFVLSDSVHGRYSRLISPGSWDLLFSASGYKTDSVRNVEVQNFKTTRVNVALIPEKSSIETNDLYKPGELKLWPVPADKELWLSIFLQKAVTCRLKIMNLEGRQVSYENLYLKEGLNTHKLLLEHISPGIYFIELVPEVGVSMRSRFIKL
jgi:hypothetical protein